MYGSSHTQNKKERRSEFRETFSFDSNQIVVDLTKFKNFLKSTNAEKPTLILGVERAVMYKFTQSVGENTSEYAIASEGIRFEAGMKINLNRQALCIKNLNILWDGEQSSRKDTFFYDQDNRVDNRLFYLTEPVSLDNAGWNDQGGDATVAYGIDLNGLATHQRNNANGLFGTTFGSTNIELKSVERFMPENADNSKESEWDDVEMEPTEILIECHDLEQLRLKLEWETFDPLENILQITGSTYDIPAPFNTWNRVRRFMFGQNFSPSLSDGYIFKFTHNFVNSTSSTQNEAARFHFNEEKFDYYFDIEMYICTP